MYLLIMIDALLLRPSLHFITLHPTTLHSTSLHLSTLHFPFKLPPNTPHYTLLPKQLRFFLLSVQSRHVSIQTNMLPQIQPVLLSVLCAVDNINTHFSATPI
jgi:hypothetical protein